MFFKNQYKLRKKNKNFNEQKFPINIINNNNSNNNIFQKSFFSSLKKLNDSNSTKIDLLKILLTFPSCDTIIFGNKYDLILTKKVYN